MIASHHALERFRIHYPKATTADLLVAVRAGRDEDPDLVLTITGRSLRPTADRYVAAQDYRGLFVIADQVVVTYLRLGLTQQRVLQGLPAQLPPASEQSVLTHFGVDEGQVYMHSSIDDMFYSTAVFRAMLRSVTQWADDSADTIRFTLDGIDLVAVVAPSRLAVTVSLADIPVEQRMSRRARAAAEQTSLREAARLKELADRYRGMA